MIQTRFIFALVVIGVFAKSASCASVGFAALDRIATFIDDSNQLANDEDSNSTNILIAAAYSRVLATRNHSKISNWLELFDNEDQLKTKVVQLKKDRVKYLRNVVKSHQRSLESKKRSSSEFSVSNAAVIRSTFERTLGNGPASDDQLDAQIIRHHFTTPMKVVNSLLSLATADKEAKKQLLLHAIKQINYKPRVIKEVLVDFDFLLRQESSKYFTLKQALSDLSHKVNELLASKVIPTVNLLQSLSNAWNRLPAVIAKAKPTFFATSLDNQLLNRMQSLIKCAALGADAFRDCRNDPAKLTAVNMHVDKSEEFLHRWQQHEQDMHQIVIPVLKRIEKLNLTTDINAKIQSTLPELECTFNRMRQLELHSIDLNRAIENSHQFTRQISSLLSSVHYLGIRQKLLAALEQIQPIQSVDSDRDETLNDDINSSLLIDMCHTAREALKLRVFPFDQDYLELCDNLPVPTLPASNPFPSPVRSAEIEKRLLANIDVLKFKISTEAGRHRPGADMLFPKRKFPAKRPFHVWKNADVKNQIQRLLSTESVTLNADILDAPKDIAIKFSKIMLDFRFADRSKQDEFYNVINGMKIKLQQIGNNHYRCDRRTFYVPTDVDIQLMYEISIDDDNQMDVSGLNDEYRAAIKRKAFLSPYSTWQIQIVDANGMEDELKEFADDEIDLQLIGVGSVVLRSEESNEVCENEELKKNYHSRLTWQVRTQFANYIQNLLTLRSSPST